MWRSCGFSARDTLQNASACDVRADLAHRKAKADLQTHRAPGRQADHPTDKTSGLGHLVVIVSYTSGRALAACFEAS